MGILGKIIDSAGEKIAQAKEQKAQEEAFVQNNPGSKAICAYMVSLFEKGNPGYQWVKENRMGLYPVIYEDAVALCYMQPGDGKSLSGIKPTDEEVVRYSFQQMYQWYGLAAGQGYSRLGTKIMRKKLEAMISGAVQQLPHIKYNIGFVVKMFQ